MKSLKSSKLMEHGRVIARAMHELKVEQKKAHDKAVTRREKMLHDAAEDALSGS